MTDRIDESQLLLRLKMREGTIFEQAKAMQELCTQYNYSQSALASLLGVSQSCVGNKIRLLRFSTWEQAQILEYGLSERHARALLRIQSPKREKLIATVGKMHLTVHQTEELVEKYANPTQDAEEHNQSSLSITTAETFLQHMQISAEKLRTLGYKTTCMTESSDGWHRITVTILE